MLISSNDAGAPSSRRTCSNIWGPRRSGWAVSKSEAGAIAKSVARENINLADAEVWRMAVRAGRQETTVVKRQPNALLWMGSAFCAALALAAGVLAVLGADARGTDWALRLTARLSFLLFWAA